MPQQLPQPDVPSVRLGMKSTIIPRMCAAVHMQEVVNCVGLPFYQVLGFFLLRFVSFHSSSTRCTLPAALGIPGCLRLRQRLGRDKSSAGCEYHQRRKRESQPVQTDRERSRVCRQRSVLPIYSHSWADRESEDFVHSNDARNRNRFCVG